MAGVGALKRLFRTFLSLKGTCHRSEVNFYSDSDGDCHVTLRVTTPGAGFQSPCRGGAHSRSQERKGSGARNPPPPPAAAALAPAPASAPAPAKRARRRGPAPAPAPAPARRARRRGPSALFKDERRRMARIDPGLLAPEAWEVEGGPALPLYALTNEDGPVPSPPPTPPPPVPRPSPTTQEKGGGHSRPPPSTQAKKGGHPCPPPAI